MDFLEEKRREISARLDELKPLVDEYHRLEAADRALSGVGDTAAGAGPKRSAGRAKRSANGSSSGKRGRPKGSGQRAQQALEQALEFAAHEREGGVDLGAQLGAKCEDALDVLEPDPSLAKVPLLFGSHGLGRPTSQRPGSSSTRARAVVASCSSCRAIDASAVPSAARSSGRSSSW